MMGFYVNPKDEEKEAFLEREGQKVKYLLPFDKRPEGTLPVILVNNGAFTAGGVAYNADEQEAFTLPHDGRYKEYYYVDVEKLKPVTRGLAEQLERMA